MGLAGIVEIHRVNPSEGGEHHPSYTEISALMLGSDT